jgi:hypothetical protein
MNDAPQTSGQKSTVEKTFYHWLLLFTLKLALAGKNSEKLAKSSNYFNN